MTLVDLKKYEKSRGLGIIMRSVEGKKRNKIYLLNLWEAENVYNHGEKNEEPRLHDWCRKRNI